MKLETSKGIESLSQKSLGFGGFEVRLLQTADEQPT